MRPCADSEALERLALEGAHDAWLEAHVSECEACGCELDRLLEERALFVRRARALDAMLDVPPGVEAVFAAFARRRERSRKSGGLALLLAAAAACVAMAVGSLALRSGARAVAEPVRAESFATPPTEDAVEAADARRWDEAAMTMRVAACMPTSSSGGGRREDPERAACAAPAEAQLSSLDGLSTFASIAELATAGSALGRVACVADVTCSVARQ